MAYSEGQLDGARDYKVGLEINYSGVQSGNSSRFDWAVRIVGTWGSWSNNTQYWSADIGGVGYSGTFTLPSGWGSPRILATGSTWHGHDANGYRPGFASSAYINTDHSNIGDGGSGNAWVDAPRIPKVPAAPTPIAIDQVTASSFRYRFSGNDDGGSAITSWQAQWDTNSSFSSPTTVTSSGTTTFSGLTPGYTYWVRSRGNNAIGSGGWSTSLNTALQLPAPTIDNWIQNTTAGLVATWTAPSVTDGLTGYRLQVATDSGFTANVQNIDLGNVLTYTLTGQPGGRVYYARVAARTAAGPNTYSASRNTMLVLNAGDLDGWTRYGTKPTNISYYTTEGIRRGTTGTEQALWVESITTGTATMTADALGIQKTVTGLTVGKAYRFQAYATLGDAPGGVMMFQYKLQVVSESSATSVMVSPSATSLGYIEFVADATSATLRILSSATTSGIPANAVVEMVAFHRIKLLELDTDFPQRLRGTVFESNLANHFDLACNSVGATWYVAKDGITKFNLPGASLPVSAVFSDAVDPSSVSYIDVTGGWDTRNTVNRIEATNYGRSGAVEDNDELIVQDLASQAEYGLYRTTLAVNLYDEAPYDGSFNDRLVALLDSHNEPQATVSAIRWNAQEDLDLAAALEVGQRIKVHYRGVDYDSQIVSIQHDITPTRWIITLTLNPL